MSEVKVSDEIQASADAVWELVRDFGGIMKWSAGGIEGVEVEGEGVGAVRTLRLPGGASLQERLEAHDDAARSFSYSFVGKLLLPAENYYATLTVVPVGADKCRVDWGSTFEPKDVPEAQVTGIIEGIYKGGIGAIKKVLES